MRWGDVRVVQSTVALLPFSCLDGRKGPRRHRLHVTGSDFSSALALRSSRHMHRSTTHQFLNSATPTRTHHFKNFTSSRPTAVGPSSRVPPKTFAARAHREISDKGKFATAQHCIVIRAARGWYGNCGEQNLLEYSERPGGGCGEWQKGEWSERASEAHWGYIEASHGLASNPTTLLA